MVYSGTRLSALTQMSTVSKISHNSATGSAVTLGAWSITYGTNKTTIYETSGVGKTEEYRFDTNGNCNMYLAEENGKVVQAESYDYEKYARDNTQYAKKETLYTTPLASYTFVGDAYENVTLDSFNNPTERSTGWKTIHKDMATGNETKQRTVTAYTYDDERRVAEERTSIETQKNGTTASVQSVTKYSYNAQGSVVREESYIEGEELSEGIEVEETEYDEKGRVVKSFTYNTLDTSSKLYSQSEYDDKGRTVFEYDETGENKTKLEYAGNTGIVRSRIMPNGSKFGYGHDGNDTVTAITQSTESGEENSTQTRYTCGKVTEVKSGNTTVRYTYDGKRRVTAVDLDGTNNYVTYAYSADGRTTTATYTGRTGSDGTTVADKT